jgi:hypothetical protein
VFDPIHKTSAPANSNANPTLTAAQQLSSCGYIIFHPDFLKVIDPFQTLRVVARKDYPFAHEAPVYLAAYDALLFSSNRLGNTSGTDQYIDLYLLSLSNGSVTQVPTSVTRGSGPEQLLMSNGATEALGRNDVVTLVTQVCERRLALHADTAAGGLVARNAETLG